MKNYLYRSLILVLAYASVSAGVMAQNADHASKISEIKNLVGSWDVEVEARLSQQGPWEKSKAGSTIRESLSGTILEEDFSGTRQNRAFLIKTLFAVNNLTTKFQRVFADSEHGVLVDFEGEKKNDSLYFDKNLSFPNGNRVKLRVVYYFKSPDEIIVESMRMPTGMTSWDITGRMRYIRSDKNTRHP